MMAFLIGDTVRLKVTVKTLDGVEEALGGSVDFGNGAGNVMTVDNVGVGATLIKV